MAEPLADRIVQLIDQINGQYFRLLIVAGPPSPEKTEALKNVHSRTGAPLINVNLELSIRMLELPVQERAQSVPRLFGEILETAGNGMLLLDNIEILFEVTLKQDPLRLIQNHSRNQTLVVSWRGAVSYGELIYATPDHPEYRRYPARDLQIVQMLESE